MDTAINTLRTQFNLGAFAVITSKKISGFLLLLFLCLLAQPVYASDELQQLIDATPAGEVLQLEDKTYVGPVTIEKPIEIIGQANTKITSKTEGISISETKNIRLENIQFDTVDTPLRINGVQGVNLTNLQFSIEQKGVVIKRVKQLTITQVTVKGEIDKHFFYRPHGIEIYDSESILVDDVNITTTQDGMYFERTNNVEVTKLFSEEARYGLHFMYANSIHIHKNIVSNNTTGIMLMIVDDAKVERNIIQRQLELNSIGLYLYDVKNIDITKNEFHENTKATVWHSVDQTKFNDNLFQANSTVFHASKSPNVIVENSEMRGNILVASSDKNGFILRGNHYDDYAGYDFNADFIGDTPHQAYTSFGQWMVRKPVYQYFIEAPSVTLLNKMDQQTRTNEKSILTDDQPVVLGSSLDLNVDVDWMKMLFGFATIAAIFVGWRKLR